MLKTDPSRGWMPYPWVPVPQAASGPLHGLTFAVKDLFHIKGYPTSAGQPMMLATSGIQTSTAPAVQACLDAGATFRGKTITDEFAFSMNGNNAHFGAPVNGADPARISGGSSSGSAAVVSHRLVDFALGTDTGGSVRAPSSHCGLIGLRPTHDRVSLQGCYPLSPSLDTGGWFARDLQTFSRVGSVLLGPDARPATRSVRLLFPADLWALLAPEVREAHGPALTLLSDLFGSPVSVSIAHESIDAMVLNLRIVQAFEAWQTNGAFIEQYCPPIGPGVRERLEWASQITLEMFASASGFRDRVKDAMRTLLADDGLLVLPTMPDIAPLRTTSEADLDRYRTASVQLLCAASLAGLPQISLPLSQREGAPLGLSLIGPAGQDRALIDLAARVMQAAESAR
jgi:amidase